MGVPAAGDHLRGRRAGPRAPVATRATSAGFPGLPDRRAHALFMTPAARTLLNEAERVADEHEAELFAILDPAEHRQLVSLLQRVALAQGLRLGVHPGLQSPGPPEMIRTQR